MIVGTASMMQSEGAAERDTFSFEAWRRTQSMSLHRLHHSTAITEGDPVSTDCLDEFDGLTLGKIPPLSDRMKSETVTKLCQDGERQPRVVILTTNDLIVSLPNSSDVSDKIPLHEIFSVTKIAVDPHDLVSNQCEKAFNVHTIEGGYNCGRVYCFCVETEESLSEWLALLSAASKACSKRVIQRTALQKYRLYAQSLTSSNMWQRINGILIVANLLVNIAQSQAVPNQGSTDLTIFDAFDITFTTIFSVELALHLFAYWLRPFFSNGWLVFDFFVVSVSLASLIFTSLPGVSVLRLMRTFRVLRLFNKLQSLRVLINALASSIFPVGNAFLMVVLVCVVYAILGVELFSDRSPELFGSFTISAWTMFTISTFDGWVDRAKLLSPDKSAVDPVVACFMCTFIPIVCWVLLPVVVAVLIDNFSCAVANEKIKAVQEEEKSQMKALGLSKADSANPLDPLLEILSRFRNSDDLSRRIGILFRVLDIDLGGTLDFHEIQEGLKKMDHLQPRVHLSSDDYHRMTKGGTLCDQNGQLDPENFDSVFREELEAFMLGKIAKALDETFVNERIVYDALLQGMKLLLVRSAVAQNKSRSTGKVSPATLAPEIQTSTLLSELKTLRKELKDAHHDILTIKKENLQRRNDLSLPESRKELTSGCSFKERNFESRSQEPTLDSEVTNGKHQVVIGNVVKTQQKEAVDRLKQGKVYQPSSNTIPGLAVYHPPTPCRGTQNHPNDERETCDSQEFSAHLDEFNQYSSPDFEGSGNKNTFVKRLPSFDGAAGPTLELKTLSVLNAEHLALNQTESHNKVIVQDAPSTAQSQRNSGSVVRFSEPERSSPDVNYLKQLAHIDRDLASDSEISSAITLLERKSDRSREHLTHPKEQIFTQYTALASDRHLLSHTDSGGIQAATNMPATNVHITAEFVLDDEDTVSG